MFELRPYQVDAIERCRRSFATGKKRPLLMAPTGAGKTVVSLKIIQKAIENGKRVVFAVDRIQLIEQTVKVIQAAGINYGVIQGDHERVRPWAPLQIASVQTLIRRDELPDCDFLIVDECHCVYQRMTELLNGVWSDVPVLGLSATPFVKGLGRIYDDLIVVSTTQELISAQYLCDYVAYGVEIDLKGVKQQANDYNQKQLAERVNKTEIIGNVVETWLKRGDNRQTLCFAVNVAHSEAIVAEFRAHGVSAEHMDAHTDRGERAAILRRYESGETKILSNCGITTKGFDSPNTDCLILARPTRSLSLHIQMLGRVLRVGDQRTDAIILDHGGNIARLGFPDDALPQVLDGGEKGNPDAPRKAKEKHPHLCVECGYMHTAFTCPGCGHTPVKKPNVVETKETLRKLNKATRAEKQEWYSMLLAYGRSRGFKKGWSAHMYREKFGVWPKGLMDHPLSPSADVRGFIKHVNIRNAHRRKAA